MKRLCAFALFGLLASGQTVMANSSMSLNGFTPRVLPVLVQVDSHGKVTEVSPAIELTPGYERLLRQTLDQLITQPANDHGRPVASQFVINLGMQASPRPDGKYDARFVYVSASPVPSGSWYWVHVDGHRLALRSRYDDLPRRRSFDRQFRDFGPQGPAYREPPVLNASRGVSRPAPPNPRAHR